MKRIFETVKPDSRIIIGYSASLFLLLLVYVATLIANSRLKQRSELMEHTYHVMLGLETLISKMKDAETGTRGYYITKDIDFLQPYIGSEREVDSLNKDLLALVKDNIPQTQRLQELQLACKERFAIFEYLMSHTNSMIIDTSFKLKPTQDKGKRSMDKIRRMVSFMQGEERKLLGERDMALKKTFSTITSISIISLLLTLVLVIIGFVTYANENKGRQQGQQKIKAYQQELNNRIDELNVANQQLIAMRITEKFAATGRIARTIAHEVRNPLTNIDLAASQLKTDVGTLDENMLYLFGVIDRNSFRINKLISDLLQTTKFSELNFSIKSLNELLNDALAMAIDRIELNEVAVKKEYKDDMMVNVDEEKMKIAFLNIFINAIEAMKPGEGKLKVASKKEDSNCIITISDNGSGMDEVSLNKLFEPYFTNKPNGNGLGLANTQNIIFNHKGTISVTSTPGNGTSFTITLPAS